MTRDLYTLRAASNLLQESLPDLIDLTYHYATSTEGADTRDVMKRRFPQQPFHTSLYRYLAQLLQALRSLPVHVPASSEKAVLERLLQLLDILDEDFLRPVTFRKGSSNNDKSWWSNRKEKKKGMHARLYRTLGAWMAEGLHIERDNKLQWLIDSTKLEAPDNTTARQLLAAVRDSVHEVEAQVPLDGRQDQDDEHEMVPIPYDTWKLVAEVCRRMEHVYSQLSHAWQCTCSEAHNTGLHFAISPCISTFNSSVQASILHHSDGWKQTWLNMRTTDSGDRPSYSDLCQDLYTSAQTTTWYEILGVSECHQPLSFDQFCHESGQKPLPRDRLCLALLVAHLYLHLGGGGWWPYSRIDKMVYFHSTDPSTGLLHPPIFRLDSVNADAAGFLARCANPGMPNLALFGQLLLEIVTWEPCTTDGSVEQRLRSLRDNRTDLAYSNRILKIIMVCTGLDGSNVLKAKGDDFSIRNNENSRRQFIDLIIRNLEYVLLKGYQVEATNMFHKAFSPCGVCNAVSTGCTSTHCSATTDRPGKVSDPRSSKRSVPEDSKTPRSPVKEDESTIAGAERPENDARVQRMAHRCRQEDLSPHDMVILNDDTGRYENVRSQHGQDSTEWLKKLAPLQKLMKETSDTPVKVAILDTGVSFHANVASDVYENRCEAYCFLEDPQSPTPSTEDKDGHGTHMASIILDISQNCKLYSARVFRDRNEVHARQSSSLSKEIVAKAITHAVDRWNVDIISMSFGFTSSSRAIREAIRHANSKGKVVLAAAGNSGSREPVRFPAIDKNVICVHAVDGNGTAYCGNPNRQRNRDGFALLGVAMEGWAPGEQRLVRRSGTSQATATACGIAALILQIMSDSQAAAEQMVAAPTYTSAMKALRQTDGMKTVFAAMCDLHDQGHIYDNVEPWRLMPRKVAPDKVLGQLCYNIIDALSMQIDDG